MKSKPDRIAKSKALLQGELRDQLALLQSYCKSYDAGQPRFAKPISNTLRLLLHHRGNSNSLLQQLNLRSGRFFTVAPPLDPRNELTECNLMSLQSTMVEGGKVKSEFVPRFTLGVGKYKQRVPFPEWWNNPVAKGTQSQVMCRREIVLAVADTDGGSHVDPGLEPVYTRFRSGAFFAWYSFAGGHEQLVHSPQSACLRTIAHELLITLEKYTPLSFESRYTYQDVPFNE